MPQLMPLFWLLYVFIFFVLVFMMKVIYSNYLLKELNFISLSMKFQKNMWLW